MALEEKIGQQHNTTLLAGESCSSDCDSAKRDGGFVAIGTGQGAKFDMLPGSLAWVSFLVAGPRGASVRAKLRRNPPAIGSIRPLSGREGDMKLMCCLAALQLLAGMVVACQRRIVAVYFFLLVTPVMVGIERESRTSRASKGKGKWRKSASSRHGFLYLAAGRQP